MTAGLSEPQQSPSIGAYHGWILGVALSSIAWARGCVATLVDNGGGNARMLQGSPFHG